MDSTTYGDFGSDDSESDSDNGEKMDCMDSDEEERVENETLLRLMTSMPHAKTKKDKEITDFEAEMEAELDRRALQIESQGGVEHQKKKLNRSSSNSSLQKLSLSPAPAPGPSVLKSSSSSSSMKSIGRQELIDSGDTRKTVRFAADGSHQESSNALAGSASAPKGSASGTGSNENTEPTKAVYDQIYFDSDESEGEDEETKNIRRQKRNLLSNDDLLYDPESDTKDQEWVDKRRRKYYAATSTSPNVKAGVGSASSSGASNSKNPQTAKPLPNSDAVLNCPACFSTLCLDCQRHDFYTGQYRAMFVMNCTINREESLRVPLKAKGKGKKHATVSTTPTFQSDSNDLFNPVKCKICNTQVAVFDVDEVYHFFNVLASHS